MKKNVKIAACVAYVRALPKLSAEAQLEHVRKAGIPDHKIYVEGSRVAGVKVAFRDVVDAIGPGTVIVLSHCYVLADPKRPKGRRDSLRANWAALEAKGTRAAPTKFWELSTGEIADNPRTRDKLRDAAVDKIGRVISGEAAGRPRLVFTAEEIAVIDRFWFDHRYRPKEQAVAAIRAEAKAQGLTRLYLVTHQQIEKRRGKRGVPLGPVVPVPRKPKAK